MQKKEKRKVIGFVLGLSEQMKLNELKKIYGFNKSELARMAINEFYTKHSNQKPNE